MKNVTGYISDQNNSGNVTDQCYRNESKRLAVEPYRFTVQTDKKSFSDAMMYCTKIKGQIFAEQRFYRGQFVLYPSNQEAFVNVTHFWLGLYEWENRWFQFGKEDPVNISSFLDPSSQRSLSQTNNSKRYGVFNIAEAKVEIAEKSDKYPTLCQVPIILDTDIGDGIRDFEMGRNRFTLYAVRVQYQEWIQKDLCAYFYSTSRALFYGKQQKDIENVI